MKFRICILMLLCCGFLGNLFCGAKARRAARQQSRAAACASCN